MIIKSFRGRLKSDGQEKIHLSTNDGRTGYKIRKLEAMPVTPDASHESVIKVFSVEQDTVTTEIDFSSQILLGAVWYAFEGSGSGDATGYMKQVFDNVTFNQDIFVTLKCGQGKDMNYYIELEQFELTLNEQTVATLANIRDIGIQ